MRWRGLQEVRSPLARAGAFNAHCGQQMFPNLPGGHFASSIEIVVPSLTPVPGGGLIFVTWTRGCVWVPVE